MPMAVTSSERNGVYITSCICHECHWQGQKLGKTSAMQQYVDWAEGRASGLLIDDRGPNGDGELEDKHECKPWR